ncbi:MAG: type II toxin-antitoxin system RelE/ParE family toxin [Rhizobiales bacterium]|nr:type II toxin-antitoxin system RelE/ParE family toxin [Hyphomicrobiales bacterium]
MRNTWSYLAVEASPATADDYLRELDQVHRRLQTRPLSSRSRFNFRPGLRSILFRSHVIFYRLAGSSVEIVRVLHGSRDLQAIMSERSRR